jgi:hypothetical protein
MDGVDNGVCAVVLLMGNLIESNNKNTGYRQQVQKSGIMYTKLGSIVDAFMKANAHDAAEKAGAYGYVDPFYKAAGCLQYIFGFLLRKMHVHENTSK